MKKLWNARKDSEGVSPVIATILMVAITVVLAAILMVMVMNMTGDDAAPSATINASAGTGQVTVTVTFISKTVVQSALDFTVNTTAIADSDVVWIGGGTNVVSGSVATVNTTATTGTVYLVYNGAVIASATF